MNEEEIDLLLDVTSSLLAAISFLEKGKERAAHLDKTFEVMLNDCNRSVKKARDFLVSKQIRKPIRGEW